MAPTTTRECPRRPYHVGKGKVYYVAARLDDAFLGAFFTRVVQDAGVARAIERDLPDGVSAMVRSGDGVEYVVLMNFTPEPREIALDEASYAPLFGDPPAQGAVRLPGYGVSVLERPARDR